MKKDDSNDVSEWSAFITDYYKLDKYFKNKGELYGCLGERVV